MRKEFEDVIFEIVEFDTDDIITLSNTLGADMKNKYNNEDGD